MSIPPGLFNSLTAKKFPHGEEVYTIHARMASEGMAQSGKGHAVQSCLLTYPAHHKSELIEGSLREKFADRRRAPPEHRCYILGQKQKAPVTV
jgi:hypothetical protein